VTEMRTCPQTTIKYK